jgi:hypothetical protein
MWNRTEQNRTEEQIKPGSRAHARGLTPCSGRRSSVRGFDGVFSARALYLPHSPTDFSFGRLLTRREEEEEALASWLQLGGWMDGSGRSHDKKRDGRAGVFVGARRGCSALTPH